MSATFNIPLLNKWIESDGSPTIAFYKFIYNMFIATAGAGIAGYTIQSNITGGVGPAVPNTLTDILDAIIGTGRGSLIVRDATTWVGLPIGPAGALISSDGTDTVYQSLTAVLDAAIGNVRGEIAVRGAATWGALALGTSGYAITSNGTDAVYALVASLAATVTLATGAPAIITTAGGDLKLDSFTHLLQVGTTFANAAVPASFSAAKVFAIKDGTGTTYYIPAATATW